MTQRTTAWLDRKGGLHPTPEGAAIADLGEAVSGFTTPAELLARRSAIEAVWAEYDAARCDPATVSRIPINRKVN